MTPRRWLSCLSAALVAASSLTVTSSVKSDEMSTQWLAAAVAGDVRTRPVASDGGESEWTPVRSGQVLATPSEVSTGTDGSVQLSRGDDGIQMAGNGTILLHAAATADAPVRIEQTTGFAEYEVETRPDRRFAVETPYLVAVVKGTAFAVGVDATGATVSVERGVVAVSTDGRSGRDVHAGETARASAGPDRDLSVGPTLRGKESSAPPADGKPADGGEAANGGQSKKGAAKDDSASGGNSGQAASGGTMGGSKDDRRGTSRGHNKDTRA